MILNTNLAAIPRPEFATTPDDVIEELSFYVEGIPASQGSKSPGRGGKGFYEADKKLPRWRATVTAAAVEALNGRPGFQKGEPLTLGAAFYFPRGKTVTREHHTVTPDLSKIVRAVEDSLKVAGAIHDDSQIIAYPGTAKRYADECPPGVRITIRRAA